MLLRSGDLVIGQPAHAWVSGQLARAWGSGRFPAPSPREPVCLAAEQHDVGWADADLAPLLDDGRPVPFLAVPRAAHVAIWRDAARRMLAQSRYAALLVSLHGTSLYARVDPDAHPPALAAKIRAYTRAERALQAALSAGLDADEVDRNRRLILALDRFSLALCHGTATTLDDVPETGGRSATIRVEPAAAAPSRPEGAALPSTASSSPASSSTSPPTAASSPAASAASAPTAASSPAPPAASPPTAASSPAPSAASPPTAASSPAAPAASPPTAASKTATPSASPRAAAPDASPGVARVRDDAAVAATTATVAYTVAPWPFAADRVVVGCEARHLPGRFRDPDDLAAALADAPWVPLRWALSPG